MSFGNPAPATRGPAPPGALVMPAASGSSRLIHPPVPGCGDRALLRAVGVPPERAAPRTLQDARRAQHALRTTARPAAVIREVPLRFEDGVVVAGEHGRIESDLLRRVLAPCERLAVFVATMGEEVDRRIDGASDVLETYLLDAVAARLTEDLGDLVRNQVAAGLETDLGATWRYGPGTCDWDVRGQKVVFGLVDAELAGMKINEHCMMTPRKSVSGVIGIGPREQVARTGCACRYCPRRDCSHRRSWP